MTIPILDAGSQKKQHQRFRARNGEFGSISIQRTSKSTGRYVHWQVSQLTRKRQKLKQHGKPYIHEDWENHLFSNTTVQNYLQFLHEV